MKNEIPTAEFILEIAAPIFNRKGYVGTSLSDITRATGLTKGAIYCNFPNKENLALQAFHRNIECVLTPLGKVIRAESDAVSKLQAIVRYYREYYSLAAKQGGCPLLNVGVDARNSNPLLYAAAREVAVMLVGNLAEILRKGIVYKQLRPETDPKITAGNIYSIIEGGICLSFLHDDEMYLQHVLDVTEDMISRMRTD